LKTKSTGSLTTVSIEKYPKNIESEVGKVSREAKIKKHMRKKLFRNFFP
jgi:hypothetical protein